MATPRRTSRRKASSSAATAGSGSQKISEGKEEPIGRGQEGKPLFIVGIGASAGGLEDFVAFLGRMPVDSGMAFVLVQHPSSDRSGILPKLVGGTTKMRVLPAEDGMRVEANTVYVFVAETTLTIRAGRLRITRPAPVPELRQPVDAFFTSLAEDQGRRAICLVFTGLGTDGARGLVAVKEHGGLTLAQANDDDSAKSGVPARAAAIGLVDNVMPVEKMPAAIVSYCRHLLNVSADRGEDRLREDAATQLEAITSLLRTKLGHDFSHYKAMTLVRRIQRRMQVLRLESVVAYMNRLRKDSAECKLLLRDFLMGVTQFFRDPAAFHAFEETVLPRLLAGKEAGDAVRIWVPGCATGEEAYSIAILLKEEMERRGAIFRVQIFATDIDENAVARARSARFAKPLVGLSRERIERWFVEDDSGYSPVRAVREMCVFSTHNLITDPPFAKLDLVSCRNLLVSFDSVLQERVISTFHDALRPGGTLFLGPSENIGRNLKRFAPLDGKHRLFSRDETGQALRQLTRLQSARQGRRLPRPDDADSTEDDRIARNVRLVLQEFFPAYVVIDAKYDILRFSGGGVGQYFEPSPGAANLNLFNILRKPLRQVIQSIARDFPTSRQAVVSPEVAVRIDGRHRTIRAIFAALPDSGPAGRLAVVAFQDVGPAPGRQEEKPGGVALERATRALKAEPTNTKSQLQAMTSDFERASKELKSVNEELQRNNIALTTKNDLLTSLNSDLKNFLDSTEIATIFLDGELRIRTFTPGVTEIFHVRDTDRGRPVSEIVTLLSYANLQSDVSDVLRLLTVIEQEVQVGTAGKYFIMRIRPYRTVYNVVDGVVITFVDITARKKAEMQMALLMGELDHRVKNILAIVSVVMSQTMKSSSSPTEFNRSMNGRIAAIARAHDLLTRNGNSETSSLRELIATELAPFDRGTGNVVLNGAGDDIALTPSTSLALTLALHELASNAVKYGGLSTPSGRIAVVWKTVNKGEDRSLLLTWTESGGPAIDRPPTRAGFGTKVIERALEHEFDAAVHREFRPSGLVCSINIPLTSEVGHVRAHNGNGDSR